MILGTICCRYGSKGIPGKNMKDLCGWPLVYWTMWCALKCPELTDVIISTDDENVSRYCAPAIYAEGRPEHLCTDTASKWDVYKYIAKKHNLKPRDILVDLDTGCPMRKPEDITACIEKLGDLDMVCTAYEPERNPYFNMIEQNRWGDWGIVRRMTPPITRRQVAPVVYSVSPAVFAIRVNALTTYNHWSEARLGVHVIPRERALDIDTPLDWDIVEFLMRRK